MANVKKGHLTASREWWKHLRWTKRVFWKAERKAGKKAAEREIGEEFQSVADDKTRAAAHDETRA